MNYKKLLSATLAVAMIASTATVSFAADANYWIDQSGIAYTKDSNGVLQPSADSEIKPGKTIYLELQHDGSLNKTTVKNVRGYADWSHGDKLVSGTVFDIVYEKANIAGTSYTVKATVSGLPTSLNTFNKQYTLTGLTLQEANNTETIKTKIIAEINKETAAISDAKATYKTDTYELVDGFSFGGKADTAIEETALLAAASYKKMAGGFIYNNITYPTEAEALAAIKLDATAINTTVYLKNGDFKTETDAFKETFTVFENNNNAYRQGDKTFIMGDVPVIGSYVGHDKYYATIAALKTAISPATITTIDNTNIIRYSMKVDIIDGETITATQNAPYNNPVTVAGVDLTAGGTSKFYTTEDAAVKSLGYTKVAQVAQVADQANGIFNGENYYLMTSLTKFTETKGYTNGTKIYTEAEGKADLPTIGGYTKYTSGYYIGANYYADDTALKTLAPSKTTVGYQPIGGGAEATSLTNIPGVAVIKDTWRNKTSKVIKSINELETEATTYIQNAIKGISLSNISKTAATARASTSKFTYFVAIPTKTDTSAKTFDLVGDIMVGKSKTDANKRDYLSFYVTLTNGAYDDGAKVSGDVDITSPDDNAVVSFEKDAGEIYIRWGDEASMIVNVTGQSDLNLAYSNKFNSEFADKHGYTNMDFLSFPGKPKFNRTGTVYIYADKDAYVYKLTEDGAVEINDLKYDKTEEAWIFRTNQPTSYVIAEDELLTADEDGKTEAPTPEIPPTNPSNPSLKPNPPTGR